MRMIDSREALDNALAELLTQDPALAPVMAEVTAAMGGPRLRKRPPGFPGLVAAVIGQQVSTASAAAMVRRVEERYGAVSPADIAAATDEDLRACGLSQAKMRTLRAAAEAILSGQCPIDAFADWTADEAHAALVAIKGIGPWTADIYLLFCLGHPDAFPAGDLALQEAARLAYGAPRPPRLQGVHGHGRALAAPARGRGDVAVGVLCCPERPRGRDRGGGGGGLRRGRLGV